jgi:hypothetical protein
MVNLLSLLRRRRAVRSARVWQDLEWRLVLFTPTPGSIGGGLYRTVRKQNREYLGPVCATGGLHEKSSADTKGLPAFTHHGVFGMQNCLFSHAGAIHFYIVLAVNCTGLRI